MVLVLEAEDFSGDVLDGQEEFAVAGGEQGGVRASELDCDLRSRDKAGLTGGFAGVGLHLAVAGKYVELQVQATGFCQGLEEVLDFFQSRIRLLHVVFLCNQYTVMSGLYVCGVAIEYSFFVE